MRAEKVVAYLLTNSAPVTTIVGTKISAVIGAQPDDAPFIVYWKETAEREKVISFGGPSIVRAIISVQCVALSYAALKDLGEAVRLALVPVFGSVAGVDVNEIQVASEGADFYDPELQLFAQLWQFQITHQE
jgi:hypothetical protein